VGFEGDLEQLILAIKARGGAASYNALGEFLIPHFQYFLLGVGFSKRAADERIGELIPDLYATASRAEPPYTEWFRAQLLDAIDYDLRMLSELREKIFKRGPESPLSGLDVHFELRPMCRVSGDIVAVYSQNGRALFALGDACGKGQHAALLSALSVGLIEMIVHDTMEPGELARRMNDALQGFHLLPMFLTLILTGWNASSRKFTFVNAGSTCMPLVVRERSAVPLLVAGPPVGLPFPADYESVTHVAAPGDIVVVYSDGITDQTNANGDMYGSDRVADAVYRNTDANARQISRCLLEDLDEFTKDRAQDDDQSLIVVRVE
jgi:sigma-B regulation protein RsbU (phosphoserine phosphatase)